MSKTKTKNQILTDAKVRKIKQMHQKGKTLVEIATVMGISDSHCGRIVRGERWQHVTI